MVSMMLYITINFSILLLANSFYYVCGVNDVIYYDELCHNTHAELNLIE